jgi:hypothetical protein
MLKFCGKDFKDMTCYKQIQLTNTAIGSVAADAYIPYGRVTRRINAPTNCSTTFTVGTSTADTVTINESGFYKVTYSITAIADEAGVVTMELITNGTSVYTVSTTAAADATVNMTLPYTIRVSPNSDGPVPVAIQIQNTGVALTSGTGNLIIEKI